MPLLDSLESLDIETESLNNLDNRYIELENESIRYGERNDCSVIAIAMIYKLTYNEAHKICYDLGRKHRGKFYTMDAIKLLGRHGKVFRIRKPNGSKYTIKTIVHTLPVGKYFIWTSGHVVTCINGKIYDWTEDRNHRVVRIVEIDSVMDLL